MTKKEKIIRLSLSGAALCVAGICTAIALLVPLETTKMKIIGSFATVFIITFVTWKFPLRFYALTLGFNVFATALGSAVNLYRSLPNYDRFVHFLSGILLAEGGYIIINAIFRKRGIKPDSVIVYCFSLFFSSALAGLWEVYEFTADCIIPSLDMQGGNTNTMGDIVSGNLGALTYTLAVIVIFLVKRHSENKRENGEVQIKNKN